MRGRAARAAAYAGLGPLGVVVAVAGTLVQSAWFPAGLLIALAGSTGLFLGGAKLTGSRLGAVVPAAAWLVTVMFLSSARPEGDFLLGAGLAPYLYLLGGSMAGVISATLPRFPPQGPRAPGNARLVD